MLDMIIFEKKFPTLKETGQELIYSIIKEIDFNSDKLLINNNELRLILDEAVNNAMEHGNRWDPEKKISVNIKKSPQCIKVTISDEGEGFQFPLESAKPEPSLSKRGRGIRIIKYLCAAEWHNNGSAIDLLIPIECAH